MSYLQIQWQTSKGWEPWAAHTFYKLEEIQIAFIDIAGLAEDHPDMAFRLMNIVTVEIIGYGWKESA